MASSRDFKSRDDWRAAKELEEARKAGTAPAEKDEEGNDINPHIPQYIKDAPWYLNAEGPSLKHQRSFKAKPKLDSIDSWYARGQRTGPKPKKFRKGACANCGAMSHKTKDCMERPRAKGARWTGKDLKRDEVVKTIKLGYDGKRDRWNGYIPSSHKQTVRKFEKMEELRRNKKAAQLKEKMTSGSSSKGKAAGDGGEETSEEDEDFKDEDDVVMTGSRDPRTKTTSRNLRIREDTAKYLFNLNLDSAHYDPKSRSMRDNPNAHKPLEEQSYAGDNFVRSGGDTKRFARLQLHAWEATDKGQDLHIQAAPSQAALLHQRYEDKKEDLESTQKRAILGKYGGEEYLGSMPTELIYSQTETYVEYARDGTIIKGGEDEKAVAISKYEEDVYIRNHTSVWGSYWDVSGETWGYACCHSTTKGAYCTGQAGIEAKKAEAERLSRITSEAESKQQAAADDAVSDQEEAPPAKPLTSEEKLQQAIEKEKRMRKQYVEKDERKRGYNSMSGTYEVTEEEMEAYRMVRSRREDPMAAYLEAEAKQQSEQDKEKKEKKKRRKHK